MNPPIPRKGQTACSGYGVWLFEKIGVPLHHGHGDDDNVYIDHEHHAAVRDVEDATEADSELLTKLWLGEPGDQADSRLEALRRNFRDLRGTGKIPSKLGWAVLKAMCKTETPSAPVRELVVKIKAMAVEREMEQDG